MASQYTEGLQSVLAFMAESGFEFGRGVDGQSIILEALRRNNGNADQVVLDMVLQSVESFEKQYTAPLWDDKVFDANRDNTAPSANSTTGLSYNIQGPDETNHEPIIYGTQPGMYDPSSFAAPTRPPSRATSPSVNIYPLTADAPRSVPPPPPLPQQSGITSFDIATPALPPRPEFGPANRESYDPNEWGMVATSGSGDSSGENDAQPMARLRSHGVPGFLRCREQHNDWLKHRMGALVMIYSSISAARNVLIRLPGRPLGLAPPDWWKYDRNNRPDSIGPIKDTQDWIVEIHQLMAFLLGDSERSYATADRLANDNGAQDDDAERNFFYRYLDAAGAPNETESPVLVSQVRVDIPHRGSPREWFANDLFGVLDLNLDADISPQPQSLYDAMDTLFYPDLALSAEDENAARLASITGAAGVITIRLNKENGMPGYRINIPEVFYLDRYSSDRIDVTEEIWWKTLEVYKSLVENKKLEDEAKKWRTSDGQSLDRKAVVDRQIKVLQERITMIQNCGRWRRHQDLNSKEAYFGEFRPESSSSPEETELIEQCEARIRQLEEVKAKIEKRLEKISSQMNKLEEECIKWRKILTEPSEEDKYNPTLPYTLVGVSSKVDVVFLRTDDPTQEKKWRRLACEGPNYLVKTKWVTFSEMMDEAACDKSCAPLLVYATEAALKEETEPLPPTFKNFIKTDNKSLRKDIDSTQPGLKRSGDPTTDSEAVRTKRSNSMDSVNVETDETADDPKGDPVETELMPPGSYKNPNNDTVHDNPEIEMQERPRTPLILQTLGNYDGGILLKGEQPNGVVADKDVEMSDIKDQEKN